MIQAIENIISNGPLAGLWDETDTTLRVYKVEYTQDLHERMQAFMEELKAVPAECSIRVGDEVISIAGNFDPSHKGDTVSVVVTKNGQLYFLTPGGFTAYLERSVKLVRGTTRLYFAEEHFVTGSGYYVPWSSALVDRRLKHDQQGNPTTFVRVIGEKALKFVPTAAENWIALDGTTAAKCESWTAVVSLKLLAMICGDIQVQGTQYTFTFKGDRTKTLLLDSAKPEHGAALKAVFPKLNDIAQWVYQEIKQVATKLTFLQQQLTYGLSDDRIEYAGEDLRRVFTSAWDGARLSFEYFLKNISKEVVKNMSDLSKTLIDNQAKIKQNIADLSSTMWKDFTTVLGVLVLQFAIKQNEVVARYFPIFGWGLIAYVAISYGVTAFNGFAFYYDTRQSMRQSWPRLYSYMDESDMNRDFFTPLKRSFIRFRGIFWIVLMAYLGLIFMVLSLFTGLGNFVQKVGHWL